MTQLNGWLNIDKPQGYSSAKVVAIVKKFLKAKKVGHGGTLDPLATGVLPICVNAATKTTEQIMKCKKSYSFNVTFGENRDTYDAEGSITGTTKKIPTEKEILENLPKFIGTIDQIPPKFSALKVGGKRAYDLARNGENFKLEKRKVEVFKLEFHGFSDKNIGNFFVECGKGFYVRSLAVDLAESVGSMGYVSKLRRESVGNFNTSNIVELEKFIEIVKLGNGEKLFIDL